MSVSRRSALSVLGLGAAATIAPEDFSRQVVGPKGYHFGVGNDPRDLSGKRRETITAALRRLADDIDAGGSFVHGMKLVSEAKHEDFLIHSLQIEFVLIADVTGVS